MTQQMRQDNLPTNYKNLTITTLNLNGLFDDRKRDNIFQYLQKKPAQIFLLQETHSTPEVIQKWEKEWKGESYWHSSTKKTSSDVALLIKANTTIEPVTIAKDDDGKILVLTFLFEKQIFQIINIYAPTNPSLRNQFFKNLQNYTNNTNNLIPAGDFKMVEGLLLDRYGGNPLNSHLLSLNYLQKIKQKNKIIDTWRKQHPNLRQYTFHNYNNLIHSRIDRIYANENLKLIKTQIMPNSFSDHEVVLLTLQIANQNPKGQGY